MSYSCDVLQIDSACSGTYASDGVGGERGVLGAELVDPSGRHRHHPDMVGISATSRRARSVINASPRGREIMRDDFRSATYLA